MATRYAPSVGVLLLLALAAGFFVATTPSGRTNVQLGARSTPTVDRNASGQRLTPNVVALTSEPTDDSEASAIQFGEPADTLVSQLRSAYSTGTLVSRLRVQAKLEEFWTSSPPRLEMLVQQVEEGSLPEGYRVSFARKIRNLAKQNTYPPMEVASAIAGLQRVLADGNESEVLRSQVALVVAELDQEERTIRKIAELLGSSNEPVVESALASLESSTNPDALRHIYEFARENADEPRRNSFAMTAALSILAADESYEIAPLIRDVIRTTRSPAASIQAISLLAHVDPSTETLEALLEAFESRDRFPDQVTLVEGAAFTALERHGPFIEHERRSLDPELLSELDEILLRKVIQ